MSIVRRVLGSVARQPVAFVALFVALCGTSIAAAPLINGSRLANESVTGAKIRNGSLASADVKDRSLRAVDFAAGQLPQGSKGDQGDRGEKGDKGDKGDAGAPGAPGATGSVAIGPWTNLLLGDDWRPSAANGYTGPVRYRKEGDVVRLAGRFERSGGGTYWQSGSLDPLFVLPAGARPAHAVILLASAETSPNEQAGIAISTNGEVRPWGAVAQGWGSLDGIAFPTT
jgi:hypothetical protein